VSRVLIGLAAALATLSAVPTVGAQPGAGAAAEPASFWQAIELARKAQAAGDNRALRDALRAALAFVPDDASVLYHLARAEALTGDERGALRTLERLTAQGVARDVTTDSAFARLRDGPEAARFRAVARRLAASAVPVVRSDTAFVLDDADFIPEGIAYDPADSAFYVGSLHGRGVLRVRLGGAMTQFVPPGAEGAGQVLGLRVDGPRRRLWAAVLDPDSAAPRFRDGSGGWAALHAYDLRTGRLLDRYPAPDSGRPHLLNDIAIAPSGDLYVTDSEGDALYRLRAGGRALERVHGGARDFTYPNGVAVASGGRLHVAHVEGASTLAPGDSVPGGIARLQTPPGITAGGIDGMYACADGLLAVQSLFDFQQVTWLQVAPDGRRVTAARALERRHPAHDAATTGAIAGGALFYIANAQLARLKPDGTLAPSATRTKSVVLRLPLPQACGESRGGTGRPRGA
jgi:hypothetical protein